MVAGKTLHSIVKFDYSNFDVLVTGGTSGIGLGIATAYRDAGATVVITGTRPGPGNYDADLQRMRYIRFELEDAAGADQVSSLVPELDILVNNAGGLLVTPEQSEYDPAVFEKAIRINLLGGYRLTHALQPTLSRSRLPGGASVIGVASLTSFFGWEVVPGYGAAKAALVQLTKTLAIAWAPRNIRVNAVAPAITLSRMNEQMAHDPEALKPFLARIPLKRIGDPSDVAGAALFLTSPAASFITGQTILIDGGYSIFG